MATRIHPDPCALVALVALVAPVALVCTGCYFPPPGCPEWNAPPECAPGVVFGTCTNEFDQATCTGLAVHDEPSDDATVLAILPESSQIDVLGAVTANGDSWFFTRNISGIDGTEVDGFVLTDFIECQPPPPLLPCGLGVVGGGLDLLAAALVLTVVAIIRRIIDRIAAVAEKRAPRRVRARAA